MDDVMIKVGVNDNPRTCHCIMKNLFYHAVGKKRPHLLEKHVRHNPQ
jgi:hypothetical protein